MSNTYWQIGQIRHRTKTNKTKQNQRRKLKRGATWTTPKTWGWTEVLMKGKHLPLITHPLLYSFVNMCWTSIYANNNNKKPAVLQKTRGNDEPNYRSSYTNPLKTERVVSSYSTSDTRCVNLVTTLQPGGKSWMMKGPIRCIYIRSSVLWCPLWISHKNDIRFVISSSFL
jgi:hypothetical protein